MQLIKIISTTDHDVFVQFEPQPNGSFLTQLETLLRTKCHGGVGVFNLADGTTRIQHTCQQHIIKQTLLDF